MSILPLQTRASPSISLVFIMAELFGMIPKPICCLHVDFGSALETSSSWQWLWRDPLKLNQVVLLLLSSPSAKTSFSFLSAHANVRRLRRSREFGKAPLSCVDAGASWAWAGSGKGWNGKE